MESVSRRAAAPARQPLPRIVDGEPVTLVGVRPIESHVDAMLEEARRPPPPKADAGIALRRPNWDRRHTSSSGYRGADAVGAQLAPRAWDSQMFALRDWIGLSHWSVAASFG